MEIDLSNPNWSVFSVVQHLIQNCDLQSKQEKLRRIWEPTYVIMYRVQRPEDDNLSNDKMMLSSAQLRTVLIQNNAKQDNLVATPISKRRRVLSTSIDTTTLGCSVEEVLELLRIINKLSKDEPTISLLNNDPQFNVPTEEFVSKKITNKLVQQVHDPLVLASSAQPDWCEYLTYTCPMLFPFETRLIYFNCTAFGTSRSIVWLQNQRDTNLERSRGPSPRREDTHDFRVGRLKHERVKVPRGKDLLEWGMQVMKYHADKKSILEVEFQDEEGTGLGPTLEFYALIAAELQRKDLGMWLCDDELMHSTSTDIVPGQGDGDGVKPPGYYIQTQSGLFPAPMPQNNSPQIDHVIKLFYFMGIFIAKALQDNRLVDLPLSQPFLKLICQAGIQMKLNETNTNIIMKSGNLNIIEDEDDLIECNVQLTEDDLLLREREELGRKARVKREKHEMKTKGWHHGVLDHNDLYLVNPIQARFLQQLSELAQQKHKILADNSLTWEDRNNQIRNLCIPLSQAQLPVRLEDLGLTFQYCPPSRVYGYSSVDLKPNGEHEEVTIDNVEEYVDLMMDFVLHSGIKKQMDAFRGKLIVNFNYLLIN